MSKIKYFLHIILDPILKLINAIRSFILYWIRFITLKNGLNKKEPRDKRIIVSLTTFPKRIHSCAIVISYILSQTVKPDKIILYLAEEQFPDHKIPLLLQKEIKKGVQVIFCDDLKSHKKYYYAIKDFPDDIIITVDDDFIYRADLIELLIKGYKKEPNAVSCLHASEITFTDQNINTYSSWKNIDELFNPSLKKVAIGLGGVLYPPHSLHPEVFNKGAIIKNCINADDLWLKTMEVMNNIPVQKVGPVYAKYVPGSQEVALYKSNILNTDQSKAENKSNNDIQFENILNWYNNYFGKNDTLILRMKK